MVVPSRFISGSTPSSSSSRITFLPAWGNILLHGLQVDPSAGDLGCLPILGVHRFEARCIALGPIDAIQGIPFSLLNRLAGFALGSRNDLVVFRLRFVDHPLALLLGLVHLVEGGLDRIRRIDILEHDLLYPDAGLVLVAKHLQLQIDQILDLLPTDRQDLVDGPITHDLAHYRFTEVAEGLLDLSHPEEVLVRIDDPVLHHPLDHDGVEITGQHVGLVLQTLPW